MGKILGFKASYVMLAVIIIGGIYYYGGLSQFLNAVIALPATLMGYLGLNSAGGGLAGGAYYGNVNFVIAQSNELTGATAAPTSPVYGLFTSFPTVGSAPKPITVTGTVYDIPKEANGICYIQAYAGTDFFLDTGHIKGMNSWISDVIVSDWDVDGIDEILLKCDVSKIAPVNPNQNPTLTISIPCVHEDIVLTVDTPADQTKGDTAVAGEITWTISGMTADYGACFAKLYVSTNCTGVSGAIEARGLELNGGYTASSGMKKSWSLPIYTDDGATYTAWYVKGGINSASNDYNDYPDGLLVWRKTAEPDTLTVTWKYQLNLGTIPACNATLNFQLIDTDGVIQAAVTDAVALTD